MRDYLSRTPEEMDASLAEPDSPERWAKAARGLRSKVADALETRNDDGIWIENNLIDADLFVRHFNAMSAYVRSAKNAGDKL